MTNLQIIAVLCIVILVPIAYFFGTQSSNEVAEDAVTNVPTQIDTEPAETDTDTEPTDATPPKATYSGKTIDLSSQGLTKVPEYVFSQKDTVILDVSNNKLEGALQAEVRHLENLKVLNLSNNNFTGVPAEVGQLSNLEELNLSGNPLTGLPYELGNLSNLKVLDLRNTNYAEQDLSVITQTLSTDVEILK